jgi:TonB family protein
MLLSGLLLFAQEPATIDSEPAVRFEQSPGYYHYLAFCRTPKAFTTQVPKPGVPLDAIEFGLGWYVKASVTHSGGATSGTSPEVDGRIVVSSHHVRFMPRDPQFADQYLDIPRSEVEFAHSSGQPDGWLRSKDIVVNFHFSKICLSCAAGTPVPPGSNADLLEQEFALLDETLTRFESGWRKTYRMSKGEPTDLTGGNQQASVAASAGPRPRPASKPSTPAEISGRSSSPVANTVSSSVMKTSAPAVTGISRRPVKIGSGAADGLLINKIPPAYPLEAKLVRLEGTVVLKAIIDRKGEVSEVIALSGPPLLESAAVDAVRQWQYRPYSLNGQPVDVETTIEVVFALDRSQPGIRAQSARK